MSTGRNNAHDGRPIVLDMRRTAALERENELAQLLNVLKPHERVAARQVFLRNYVRAGATLQGCLDYVRAIFTLDLNPKGPWWAK